MNVHHVITAINGLVAVIDECEAFTEEGAESDYVFGALRDFVITLCT